jgi:DMSO/TMAO reductase YedYZ heme-binding membrane subunit
VNPQFWWYLARAAGLTAWVAGLASVVWGVALATRVLGGRPRPAWLLDLHRHLGAVTVSAVGVHLGALVADSYLHFGLADLLVPYASSWRSGAVAWGIVAFWLLVAIEVTSLLGRRIPKRWWRRVHLTSYVVAVATTVHLFTAGSDAHSPLVRFVLAGASAAVAGSLAYRLAGPRRVRAASA